MMRLLEHRSLRPSRLLLPALVLLLAANAGCGGAAEGPSAPATGSGAAEAVDPARAARFEQAGAALATHLRAVRRKGLLPRMLDACEALLEETRGSTYAFREGYGISLRDTWMVLTWNRGTARPGRTVEQEERARREGLAGIVELARKLRERGTELVLVPIPRLHQVYPDRVDPRIEVPADFVGVDPATTLYLGELTAAGVTVVHLTPAFAAVRESDAADEDRYLFHAFDNHWTPRGVHLAADEIAKVVKGLEGSVPGALTEGIGWRVDHHEVTFKVPPPRGNGVPPIDPLTKVWIDAIVDEAGKPALPTDPSSPILLLGDSNAQWYAEHAAAIGDQLGARLGRRLDVIALPGSLADGVWKSVARRSRPGETLSDKKVVVWVFELNMLLDAELAGVAGLVE